MEILIKSAPILRTVINKEVKIFLWNFNQWEKLKANIYKTYLGLKENSKKK